MTLVYLLAGEASGDLLGARLMAALKRHRPELQFAGVGGERMAEQGLTSLFPMHDLALMGFLEVVPKLRLLRRRMREAEADILARRPALLVTIDAPGFTLRVAAKVRPAGLRVLHYVAPQFWAWRPGRVEKFRQHVDEVLALLPFEPAFFEAHGMQVRFVGHPVLESGADAGDAQRFRATHGLRPEERVVVAMPGSRRGEVKRHLGVFGAALGLLAAEFPGLRPVVPLAGAVAETVRAGTADWPARPILVSAPADKHDAYAAAEVGLIKSGSSSLEVALAGVPHVVGYRLNPITARIAEHWLKVPFVSIVNLLAERAVAPELLARNCTPAALAAALGTLLREPAAREAQRAGFAEVMHRLRPPEGVPSEAAAAAVLALLDPPAA
jgi:lipid-A-disaccharide synthase